MINTAPEINWRTTARALIAAALIGSQGESRKQVRARIRAAFAQYPSERQGYPYKVWLQERAYALGERTRPHRTPFYLRPRKLENIMPAARDWATAKGLVEVTAVLDVHL
jgi:hypothetical protein